MNKRSLLIQLLMSQPEFNGHLQTELKQATLSQVRELMQEIDRSGCIRNYSELRLNRYQDKWEGCLYAVDEWNVGEHPRGHTDKLLLAIERVEENDSADI